MDKSVTLATPAPPAVSLQHALARIGASLEPMPISARFSLRCDAAGQKLAGKALGFSLPHSPSTGIEAASRAALWLGPDEWLLLDRNGSSEALADAMTQALEGAAYSLVDISHRQLGFRLSGKLAARLLSSGCPLDLHPSRFPVGMATRTLFHKAEIVLWRTNESAFHLEIWRSFAPYCLGHLEEAARGAIGLVA